MPIYDDLDDRASHVDRLELCRRAFEETGNPLYAWQALGLVFLMRRVRLNQDIPGTFTKLPARLSRRNRPSNGSPDRDFFREAHAIVTGASQMKPTAEHLDALWSLVELPEWLGEYLEACGKRLLGVPMDVVDRKPLVRASGGGLHLEIDEVRERPPVPAEAGEGPGAIGHALRFSEGLAKAREHWGGPFDEQERRALEVVRFAWEKHLTVNAAIGELSKELGRSQTQLHEYVRGAQHYALRFMQDRVSEATGATPPSDRAAHAYQALCRQRARAAQATAHQ